jgi:hypothetical protein
MLFRRSKPAPPPKGVPPLRKKAKSPADGDLGIGLSLQPECIKIY